MNELREKHVERFQSLAVEIAGALGGHLTKAPNADQYWYAALTTSAGVPLTLHAYDMEAPAARLEIEPEWPAYSDSEGRKQWIRGRDTLGYDERKEPPVMKIGCALSRTAASISADIKRRLLPSAAPVYARAFKRCQENEAYSRGTMDALRTLAARVGVAVRDNGARKSLYVDSLTLSVQGPDSVRIEVHSCTLEQAARIVELMRKLAPAEAT